MKGNSVHVKRNFRETKQFDLIILPTNFHLPTGNEFFLSRNTIYINFLDYIRVKKP